MGWEPHDLETGPGFLVVLLRAPPLARRPYRASGLVLGSWAVISGTTRNVGGGRFFLPFNGVRLKFRTHSTKVGNDNG